MELTVGGKSLAEAKIQRGIFQGDSLSPWLFVTAMMPHNHIHRKCIDGFKLSKLQEKINHLMYMDDIKLCQKWKSTRNFYTGTENRYIRMESGIEKMCHAINEKRQTTPDGRNGSTKLKKNLEHTEKGKPTNIWEYWKLAPSNKWR